MPRTQLVKYSLTAIAGSLPVAGILAVVFFSSSIGVPLLAGSIVASAYLQAMIFRRYTSEKERQ